MFQDSITKSIALAARRIMTEATALKAGTKVKFGNIDSTSKADWGSQEVFDMANDHDGQTATVTSIANDGYYDIKFADGLELAAVSDAHLTEGLNTAPSANNSLYRDIKGTTPIADIETGKNATEDCGEPGCEDDDGSSAIVKEDSSHCEDCGCLLDRDNEDVFCTNCASKQYPGISESAHDLKIGSELSINGAWWIVDSILGDIAYISDQDGKEDEIAIGKSNYEVVKEGVEEPRAGIEKTFKQMHTIEASDDTDAEKQEGTEAMDDSDPARPVGTKLEGAQKDGEAENTQVVKTIAKSTQPGQAQAPKANGTPQAGAESTKGLKDTTKGGSQSAKAPKASGASQPGSESAKSVKNTAPDGTLKAMAPKAGQVSPEPTPAGLKESAKKVIKESSSNVIKIMLLIDELDQKEAKDLFDELCEWYEVAAHDTYEPKCKEIAKHLDACSAIMYAMNKE